MTPEEYRVEGFCYYDNDIEKALECFKKAAESKDILSAITLAIYYHDKVEDNDTAMEWLDKTIEWYTEAGEPEDIREFVSEAYYLKGQMLYDDEMPYDAWDYLDKAEQMGNTNAYIEMGFFFYEGYGSDDEKPNVAAALELWKQGMEKGNKYCKDIYMNHRDEYYGEASNPKKIVFDKGDGYKDCYEGDVNAEGQPHGFGHMDYDMNGYYAEYEGQWENGKRSGRGHYHKSNKGGGARHSYDYKGDWLDDKEHGQGTATKSDEVGLHRSTISETYTGGFSEGRRTGHGVIEKDNYDGSFRDGKNRFEGFFVDGSAIGLGVWEYANGDRFEGLFAFHGNPSIYAPATVRNGHGIYTFANRLKFEGEWKNDSFVTESYQPDPSLKTPTLLVTESHEGFDYSYSGTFLLVPEVGTMHYDEAATIYNSCFNTKANELNIVEVTTDSVTYEVRGIFVSDCKSFNETIHRGETKEHTDVRNCTATIEGDDYDYTVEDSLKVICK